LAQWDAVHNAREELNGLIDGFPDFSLHEADARVSAETLSDLKTTVALLQEVNTQLDVAGDREAPSHTRIANREEPRAHAAVKATYDNPYDELTLTFERAETLIQAMMDAQMSGEDRNLVGLGAMAQLQLDYALDICHANNKYWYKNPGEQGSAPTATT
jgi:hypothetical protein